MEPKPPTKPTLDGLERRWGARWEADGIYRFDRTPAPGGGVLDRLPAA